VVPSGVRGLQAAGALLQALAETPVDVPDRESLERAARASLAHRRLPRIDGAERSPGAQAKCRSCREPSRAGAGASGSSSTKRGASLREGSCTSTAARPYFETDDVLDRVLHFSRDLSADEREELRRACATVRAARRCRGAEAGRGLSSLIPPSEP